MNSKLHKWFTWDPKNEAKLRMNFKNRWHAQLRDFLGKVRKFNKKPIGIHDNQWKAFEQYSTNEDFKKLYQHAQKNWLGDQENLGPFLHTRELIPMHECRSHLINNFNSYNFFKLFFGLG